MVRKICKRFSDDITLYMSSSTPQRLEDTLTKVHSMILKIKAGEELPIVILDKETGKFIGCGGAHKLKTGMPELGIWIKKTAHGNKFGLETVTALKQWIEKNIPYSYIVYPADKRNIPSRKIAESLGGVIGAEYKKEKANGNILDIVEYRIHK